MVYRIRDGLVEFRCIRWRYLDNIRSCISSIGADNRPTTQEYASSLLWHQQLEFIMKSMKIVIPLHVIS